MADTVTSPEARLHALQSALKAVTDDMDRAGGDGYGMPECPWCHAQTDDPEYQHKADCELAAARAVLVRSVEAPKDELRDVIQECIDHHKRNGGCSYCGGLPHSLGCFVGRFEALMKPSLPTAEDVRGILKAGEAPAIPVPQDETHETNDDDLTRRDTRDSSVVSSPPQPADGDK